ncbi:hypothetical protein X777_14561 [Ooceraea biroi]|uniref:Uncharacterized protein n=1 Tax=Ooceraea biroi TaxID=2015173 RepID=A0A026WWT2_OOCBI|nr:hypothetical protein X777_14561 [Ooceraea biroi]
MIYQKKCLCREQKRKKKCKNIKYKGVLDLIPAKHRINSASDNIDISTILSKSSKTVYETQKHIAAQQDPTDDNIKRLLSLSSYSLKPETASNLLQRAVRERYKKKEKKKEPEETIFTEEDFKKFEQEYQE